jgi:hypothetical protein
MSVTMKFLLLFADFMFASVESMLFESVQMRTGSLISLSLTYCSALK